jgi:putative tryptophan/tyrosine transport system substrate-binding protein
MHFSISRSSCAAKSKRAWAVSDPVAQGLVTNLSHPGENLTGFSVFEPNIGSKWLQLLKDIAPSVTNVAVMFNPSTSPYNDLWMRSIEAAAPVVGMSTTRAVILDEEDIRKTISLVSMKPGGGLIVPSDSFTYERATLITSLAASSRLPTLYVDLTEQLRKGANYGVKRAYAC